MFNPSILFNAANFDPETGAYYGGELPEFTFNGNEMGNGTQFSEPDDDSGNTGGGSIWGNLGGILGGIAGIGNAWANIQSAQNGGSPNQFTPQPQQTVTPAPRPNNSLLLIGVGLLVILLLIFMFKK